MLKLKTISPTGSYNIDLPGDVIEDIDEIVSSYWRPNSDVLLQLSSRTRNEGRQVGAGERLKDGFKGCTLTKITPEDLRIADCPDVSAESGIVENGIRWIYGWAVWPDLAIYITVSGKKEELKTFGGWAFEAVHSIRR